MKTILKLLYSWYRRKKELEDLESYVISEVFRTDMLSFGLVMKPSRRLRIQYNLKEKWNRFPVWYFLEEYFKVHKDRELVKKSLDRAIQEIYELKKQLAIYADKNQNQ